MHIYVITELEQKWNSLLAVYINTHTHALYSSAYTHLKDIDTYIIFIYTILVPQYKLLQNIYKLFILCKYQNFQYSINKRRRNCEHFQWIRWKKYICYERLKHWYMRNHYNLKFKERNIKISYLYTVFNF